MNNDINSAINVLIFEVDQEIKGKGELSDTSLELLNKLVVDLTDRVMLHLNT